jgi:hypothetical protein
VLAVRLVLQLRPEETEALQQFIKALRVCYQPMAVSAVTQVLIPAAKMVLRVMEVHPAIQIAVVQMNGMALAAVVDQVVLVPLAKQVAQERTPTEQLQIMAR